MKKLFLYAMLIFPCSLMAQFGVKAGLNFANVTNASDINSSSETGFHGGLFLAPPSKGIPASRTEILFSRQGYNYKTNTNTGNVNLDYIMLPQFMAFNITKFVQLQVGFQMAFLISAKADSTSSSGEYGAYSNIMDFYNRFDYGLGGGVEVHPISGLLVGARINVSFGDLYSSNPEDYANGTPPSFIPKVDVKNNVFQLFVGWRFGKQPASKKKEKKENTQP
jgi:hypothetical protein